jgi:hypothetical protein
MNEIVTAEEILREYIDFDDINGNDTVELLPLTIADIMIEFATIHVEAALNGASDKLYDTYHTVCEDGTVKGVFRTQQEALNLANHLNETTDFYHDWNKVVRLGGGMSKHTILNSYSLDNIK